MLAGILPTTVKAAGPTVELSSGTDASATGYSYVGSTNTLTMENYSGSNNFVFKDSDAVLC